MFRLQAQTFWALLCIILPTYAQATPDYDAGVPKSNRFWWQNQLDLSPLRAHQNASNPYGEDFAYEEEFAKLDLNALKTEINAPY